VKSTTGRQERLEAAPSAVRKCLSKTRLPRNRLRYATMATPGIVDQLGKVRICPVLSDWSDFSLKDALQADLRCEIAVENDTNLSAVGERWRRCAPRSGTSVWVLTGRRTSMGILINGELYRGDNGAAGEVGWSAELGWEEVRQQQLSFLRCTPCSAGGPRNELNGLYSRPPAAHASELMSIPMARRARNCW
jgi:hypothetical protein